MSNKQTLRLIFELTGFAAALSQANGLCVAKVNDKTFRASTWRAVLDKIKKEYGQHP